MSHNQPEQLEAKLFEDDTIDFGHYIQIITRYYLRILGLAVFITLFVALFVLSLQPRYIATASLLIEAEQANVLSIEEVYGLDSSRKEYFETQYQILRSRQIAAKVVEELSLFDNPDFDLIVQRENKGLVGSTIKSLKSTIKEILPFLSSTPESVETPEELMNARIVFAIKSVSEGLSISPVRNTQVVDISFEANNPNTAALVANTVADVYIESYLESKLNMTTKATSWLNESLQGLRTKLTVAEKKLSDFYERERLVDIDGVVGLASENLQQLNEQLIDSQALLQRNRAIYEQVQNANASPEQLTVLPEVLNHPSIQSIKREQILVESKVSELKEIYGPKHPTMIAANAELNSINDSLTSQVRRLAQGITSEFQAAIAKVDDLKNDVELAKIEFRNLNNLDNQRRSLQREVDINQQLYDSFFTRLKETDELGGFESANARVLDAALPPQFPARPKKGLIVAATFVASTLLGVFLALLLDILNSGIRSVEDVEKKLGQRMLGIIPWQAHKKNENLSLRHFFDKTHHTFSESVRTLRTSLQLLHLDKQSKTILVTSSVPKEGKSTVSINLAFAMGQLNKVLIIDTDLRRPTIGKLFELPGFQPGLANLIAGTHELDECIVNDDASGVDVICAGTLPPNPQELLASEQFETLVNDLKQKYDHIIMDSAPTQAVSDSVLVSKHCDSVLYVVRADSTSQKVINQGLSRFMQIGHRVDGIVLNQVDLKKAKKSGAYSGFYDQYGYNAYSNDSYTSKEQA